MAIAEPDELDPVNTGGRRADLLLKIVVAPCDDTLLRHFPEHSKAPGKDATDERPREI
jgi:hypothetical protein